jgi:hypothetical protein
MEAQCGARPTPGKLRWKERRKSVTLTDPHEEPVRKEPFAACGKRLPLQLLGVTQQLLRI